MKHFLLTVCLFVAAGAVAQTRYEVKGTAPAGVKQVYMVQPETGRTDSVAVSGGTFSFAGEVARPAFALLRAQGETVMPVYLDATPATVDWSSMAVKGSAVNAELSQWLAQFKPYFDMNKQFAREVAALKAAGGQQPDSVKQRVMMKGKLMADGLAKLTVKCCEAGKTSLVPAVFLYLNGQLLSVEELLTVGEENRAYMASPLLNGLRVRLKALRRQEVGAMFTDVELADTAGVKHKLSEYVGRGGYVLIDFWASWCGPCRAEMPAVKAAYERFAPKGFQVVGLSFDQNAAAWKAGIKKLGITWPQLSDLKGWKSAAGQTYGVNSIPLTLLVGPDGKIVARALRGDELMRKLEEIYQ